MQCDNRVLAVTSLAMAFIMAIGCVALMDVSEADTVEYDQDLGQFWSYTVQFVFNGSNAQSISWDFGDGSAPSTDFNPKHEFPAKGVYTVTQTTTNTMGETVEHYKVEIMGFPYITLVYDNGSENGTIQQTAYKVAAEKPADPVKEGFQFKGWFTDSGCTSAYDWNALVTEPFTLYAGWGTGSQAGGDGDKDDDGKDSDDGQIYLYAAIACIAVATICAVAAVVTGTIYIAIPAAILVMVGVVAGLLHGGLI